MSPSERTLQSTFSAGRFNVLAPSCVTSVMIQAALFVIFTGLSLVQLCRQRAWFFWAFTVALALQATGYITQAFLQHDETNHLLYLAAFACLTLAPALLALSTISAFRKLHSSTVLMPYRTSYRTMWMPERAAAPFCTAIQISAITFFLLGIAALSALHSPTPIEGREGALARLAYEAMAHAFLRLAWIVQFVGLAVFLIVSSGSTVLDYLDGRSRRLYWATNWVALLNLARTIWKLVDIMQLEPESFNLAAESSTAQGLWDALPLLAAFVLFTKYCPGKNQNTNAGFDQILIDRKPAHLAYESPSSC